MKRNPTLKIRSLLQSAPSVGGFLRLAAAFLFAVLGGLINLLGPPFRVWDIAFYPFACSLVILVAIFGIFFLGEPVTHRN